MARQISPLRFIMEPTTLDRVQDTTQQGTQETTRYPFGDVSSIEPDGPGRYRGEVSPEWTIAGKPNGGYLLAMLARAALDLDDHRHVLAASAHYLRSPGPGPVAIEAEVLRAGRSASQLRARMSQDGAACVEALVTVSDLSEDAKPNWDGGAPRPGSAACEDCVRLPSQAPGGLNVAIMDQAEVRLDPRSLGFAAGRPSGRGELHGWLALPDGEDFDPVSLLY